MKKILAILSLMLLMGCHQSESENRQRCQQVCKENYGTDVKSVGIMYGKCFCE